MLAGIDTLRNNTMMAAVMRGFHTTLGSINLADPAEWAGYGEDYSPYKSGAGSGGGYTPVYYPPTTPAQQPSGTNWTQIIPAIGQAVGQSIALATGKPIYNQNPTTVYRAANPQGTTGDTVTDAAKTGAGITAQLGDFIKKNSGVVLAGGIALLLFKSGRK